MNDRPVILFVDDEPHVLQGLRRMLHAMAHEWRMEFVQSAEAAVDLLAALPVDVVVTDMRMPGMDGAALLERIRERWPVVTRIVLSGHSEQEGVIRAISAAHLYLAKPCSAELLKRTLRRSLRLRELVAEPALRTLIAGLNHLPSLPDLYLRISRALADPECTAQQIGELVGRDIPFSVKLLQIVNSAFFGLPRSISDPGEAVVLLGTELVRAIVLGAKVFSSAEERLGETEEIRALWQHSVRIAGMARALAQKLGLPRSQCEEAFLAGFVHDLGHLVLLENRQEQSRKCAQLVEEGMPTPAAEATVFGVTRAVVSAALLTTWGLPNPVVEAVAFAHEPRRCGEAVCGPLTVLHLALAWSDEDCGAPTAVDRIDHVYVGQLGIAETLQRWRVECWTPATSCAGRES